MSQANPTDIQMNAYAESYVLYGDQSRAWRVAYPDSLCKQAHVHTKASLMHGMAKVQQRVKEVRSNLIKASEEEFNITVSDLKKMLVMAAQSGLKLKIDAQGNKIPIAITGTVAAIAEINRMDGNHAAVKQDHLSSDGSMTPKSFNDFYDKE